jgi:very-short-patch-repair endonuclease
MGPERPRSAQLSTKKNPLWTAPPSGSTISRVTPPNEPDSARPLNHLLWRQHEVISRHQALALMSVKTLRGKVNSGRWQRPGRNVVVAHNGPLTIDQRLWIAVLSVGHDAVLAGITAAQRCGLRDRRSAFIHLAVTTAQGQLETPHGVVIHRTSTLQSRDINAAGRPRHTTIARSIVDAAAWARSDEDAYALVVSAYQQRLLQAGDLDEVVARLVRSRRRKLVLAASREAEGGVQSLPEGELVAGLKRDGLPIPQLQVRRRDACGRQRYLDGYYPEWRIHLEVDGATHLDARSYWEDMKRQNDLWVAGDRVLRFPASAIRLHLWDVLRQIRRALLAAGWTPPNLG